MPYCVINDNEQRALDSLREMISENDYRRYLKYGFITVVGQSGCIYQIYRGDKKTRVWCRGVLQKEICVHLEDYRIPPTDKVTAFKAIIESSEEEFRKLGNVYNILKIAA